MMCCHDHLSVTDIIGCGAWIKSPCLIPLRTTPSKYRDVEYGCRTQRYGAVII